MLVDGKQARQALVVGKKIREQKKHQLLSILDKTQYVPSEKFSILEESSAKNSSSIPNKELYSSIIGDQFADEFLG